MPGIANYPFFNDKQTSETYFQQHHKGIFGFRQQLYRQEISPQLHVGDILFYRLDTWHRGTPVIPGKVRWVMNMVFKKKDCFWISHWNPGWVKKAYYQDLEQLFISMNPQQRSILGVPKPGHVYWDIDKIEKLELRYPGIDVSPYLEKLKTHTSRCKINTSS